MTRIFIPGITPPTEQKPAWWFAFVGNKLLIRDRDRVASPSGEATPLEYRTGNQIPHLINLAEINLTPVRTQFLGTIDNHPCYCAELPKDTVPPEGMIFRGLRELYGILEEDFFALSGRAFQIMEWDRTHQYCGHCATGTTQLAGDRAKRCPNCGLVNYPRLCPAIIVLISRGDELLLARANRFPQALYSVLAGFVEPGESLEETVIREVKEEVGILVKNIRYFGSQSWPFPNSLMIGFTADYADGEIVIEEKEIADAAWFKKDNLPQIPPKLSIARKLIDAFVSS